MKTSDRTGIYHLDKGTMKNSRLKAVRTTPDECISDIKSQFIRHPIFQARVRTSPRQAAGASDLAFYRGHHSGIHDAYRTLRIRHPEAAGDLLEAFGMDKTGAI